MTPSQLERRTRLLDAVPALVLSGMDENMQMKDIAEHAGVALGTVYRYFSCKDHLLAEAMVRWAAAMRPQDAPPTVLAGSPGERLWAALSRGLRAYERNPAFASIVVVVANSSDPYAGRAYLRLSATVDGDLGELLSDVEQPRRDRILKVVGAMWFASLSEWTKGRMTPGDVRTNLSDTVELVFGTSEVDSP